MVDNKKFGELVLHNTLVLAEALSEAGGAPLHILPPVSTFLLSLAQNNIILDAKYVKDR